MLFSNRPLAIVTFSCLFLAMIIVGQSRNHSNLCDWMQCANGGRCESSVLGYHCRCLFGFTGILCEDQMNITMCSTNPCLHDGNCTITNDHIVQCKCSRKYTGVHCETLL